MPYLKPTAQSSSSPYIGALLAMSDDLAEGLLDEAARAELSGANDGSFPYRAGNHVGCRAGEQYHVFAGVRIEPLGFREENVGDMQVRHVHDEAGIRLLMVRGSKCNGPVFRIGEKGDRTRRLINANAEALGYVHTLFPSDTTERKDGTVLSFWVLVQSDKVRSVSVYLLLPISIDAEGRFLTVAEWKLLGSREVPIAEVLGKPRTAPAPRDMDMGDFDIERREQPGEDQ